MRGFALHKHISLVLKPSASEMQYIRNLFHVKIDKLQTSCLWTLQICLSLSLKALESESKLKETSFLRDVLRRFGCLVSVSPESLFSFIPNPSQ